ncbi:hypothetical protein IX339_000472 [Porphyromonas levii]|uniref:glycosyltransferase family 2 protein n=1 Tax=Porphyromonas levii TaxID=28114 RepID=UPI001B8C4919|nr:glycosyltransferase family 2 protein [Porphyromonas levii]MBR8731035.1 hypothetical protein [Porphyromonas levii]
MKKIAVVILSWNARSLLEQYLPSVVAHTPSELADIVLADNGSTDSSVAYALSLGVKVLELPQNYGFARGYNEAIKQLKHEYILLLNNDVRVTPGWLEPLFAFMEQHPEVVSVQPKIRWDRERERYEYAGAEGGYMDWLGYPFCRGRIFDTLEQDQGQYGSEPKRVFWTTGAAMLVRRDNYVVEGGLDERFFAHQEEIDLCWRWNSAGHQLFVVPQSEVFHYGGASLNAENPHKTFLNFRNNLLMLRKNLPDSRRWWVLTLRLFLDLLAALVFVLRRKPKDAMAVFKAWNAFRQTSAAQRTEGRVQSYQRLYRHSILLRYHLFGEKTFDKLKP